MELEAGEYFAITQGIKRSDATFFSSFLGLDSESWKKPQEDKEIRYDRSYEGLVFLACEVCYPMVAAKLVFGDKSWIGPTVSLNLEEIEIMTLTKKYVDEIKRGQINDRHQ